MTFRLIMAAALSTWPAIAVAAEPAKEAAPAAAEQKPAALDGNSPIEAIVATQAGKAAIEKHLPTVLSHPDYEQFKMMSLRALASVSGGLITEDRIAAVEADLKVLK